MRKVTIVCDRCGKEYKVDFTEEERRKINLVNEAEYDLDICADCYKSLEKWYKETKDEH